MPDALTPPQGLIAITDRRKIYGFPLGLGVGGCGTKVTVTPPPCYRMGGGMKALLVGEYQPAQWPPVQEYPLYNKKFPSGIAAVVLADGNIPKGRASGSCRAVVVPDEDIEKDQLICSFVIARVETIPP